MNPGDLLSRLLFKQIEGRGVFYPYGASGPGYYFTATDRAPKAGEYKYLLQGMVKVSELVVTFTILTNAGQEPIAHQALSMIKSAVHLAK